MSELTAAAEQVVMPADVPKKAAIIDDAFDDVMEGEISFVDFKEFHQSVSENGAFDLALQKLNIAIPDTSEWEETSDDFLTFLRELWNNRDDAELRPLINHEKLFANKIAKLSELESLCKNIEGQNITVQRFKSSVNDMGVFETGEYVYVFIDYNLGVKAGNDAVINAQKIAKDIYVSCPKERKPVTILMSSDAVDEPKKEKFQQDAGMLEGVFRFSAKSDLVDANKVSLLVRAYREEFYSNHKLQEYILALIAAANEAQKEFETEVKTLRIEDYEFIQNSVLQAEKHPLGDYLAWLYSSHWGALLLRNADLKKKQEEIDEVIAVKKPLHHTVPSPKLAEIFMSALFESGLGEIKYHPWEGQDAKVAKLPYLHLGDIFIKTGDVRVYMILNPQCDLERPSKSKEFQSILVLPGRMDILENDVEADTAKTDFFIFEEKQYRIYWDLSQLQTIPYNEFEGWQKESDLTRNFRLRLPFALEIQQQFTSNMSRVGLPVAPPMSTTITLEVKYKRYDNTSIDFITKNHEYSFLPVARSGKQEIRLTLKFALDFKQAIIQEYESLVELNKAKTEAGADIPANLVKSIERIKKFIEGFDDWFFDNRIFNYPKESSINKLPNETVLVTRNRSGDPVFSAQSLFWINLATPVAATVMQEKFEDEDAEDNDTCKVHIEIVGAEDESPKEAHGEKKN